MEMVSKGMRGDDVIGNDCYQTLTHPLIMYDNSSYSLLFPWVHVKPTAMQIPNGVSPLPVHTALDSACVKSTSCVFVLKRKRWMAGHCTAVLIKSCSPHNVSAPAPNTTAHSLSHKHTHVEYPKSSDPPTQKWVTCRKQYQQREGPVKYREEDRGRGSHKDRKRQKQRQHMLWCLGIF